MIGLENQIKYPNILLYMIPNCFRANCKKLNMGEGTPDFQFFAICLEMVRNHVKKYNETFDPIFKTHLLV